MTEPATSEGFDAKQARYDNPSGWIQLTRYETVRLLIDAMLEAPPGHRFNKSELERRTGLSREAIRDHIPFLIELGVVNEVQEGQWAEYELNDDGKVTQELFELSSAVNSVLNGEPKNVQEPISIKAPESGNDDDRRRPPESVELVDNANRRHDDDDLVTQPPTEFRHANAD